jgi:hypothetical protein
MNHGYRKGHRINYRKGYFRFPDKTVFMDLADIRGFLGVSLEFQNRGAELGKVSIPRSFFYRACKRNNVGTHSMMEFLSKSIPSFRPYTFPIEIHAVPTSFRTYKGWKTKGAHVRRGETSYAREYNFMGGEDSVLFSNSQVIRYHK